MPLEKVKLFFMTLGVSRTPLCTGGGVISATFLLKMPEFAGTAPLLSIDAGGVC
jgi:hypothetical protein